MTYEQRLNISIIGDELTIFKTPTDTLIAVGYSRIVIGKRGPYVEFRPYHINNKYVYIPNDQQWRLNNNSIYYIEYRTTDQSNLKLYYQTRTVDYADYKVGMLYISPFELYVNDEVLIKRKQ